MSINQRVVQLIDLEKSNKNFSDKTGIGTSTIAMMKNGGSKISATNIQKIAESYPNLNLRWLILGKGEMWMENPDEDIEFDSMEKRIAKIEEKINRMDMRLAEQEKK